ncbi:MAG: hypothetical protein OXI66_18395 [Boseongicola sp.]|nr:hypothetical protein [Boseongicola sp.]
MRHTPLPLTQKGIRRSPTPVNQGTRSAKTQGHTRLHFATVPSRISLAKTNRLRAGAGQQRRRFRTDNPTQREDTGKASSDSALAQLEWPEASNERLRSGIGIGTWARQSPPVVLFLPADRREKASLTAHVTLDDLNMALSMTKAPEILICAVVNISVFRK